MRLRSGQAALAVVGAPAPAPRPAHAPVSGSRAALVVGAREMAEEAVQQMEKHLAHVQDGGSMLQVIEARAHLDAARDTLAAVQRDQAYAQAWAADPDRLTTVDDLAHLVGDGGAAVRLTVDEAVAALVRRLLPVVESFNTELRATALAVREGEPGALPPELYRHPGEINFERQVMQALRKATS